MIIDLSLSIVRGLTQFVKTFITVNGNDITIFGTPLTLELIRGTTNNDPVSLLGSNGTAPTKTAVAPAGLAVIGQPTEEATRVSFLMAPSSSVGWTFIEPFLGATFQGGLVTVAAGGTVTNVPVTGRSGVVRLATGVTASANQRAGVTANAVAAISLGYGRAQFFAPCRPQALLFDGVTTTGRLSVGFNDITTTQTADGAFFRFDGTSSNWVAVTRSNSVETSVDTGVPAVLGTWNDFYVDLDAPGSTALYYVNGSLVATITTNIPIAAGRQTGYGVHVVRTSANGVDVQLECDMIAARLNHVSLLPFE